MLDFPLWGFFTVLCRTPTYALPILRHPFGDGRELVIASMMAKYCVVSKTIDSNYFNIQTLSDAFF